MKTEKAVSRKEILVEYLSGPSKGDALPTSGGGTSAERQRRATVEVANPLNISAERLSLSISWRGE